MIRQFRNSALNVGVKCCLVLIFPFKVMKYWSQSQASLYRRQEKNEKKKKNLEKLPVHRWAAMDAGWQTLDCFTFTDNRWSLINQTCIKSEQWQVKLSSSHPGVEMDLSLSSSSYFRAATLCFYVHYIKTTAQLGNVQDKPVKMPEMNSLSVRGSLPRLKWHACVSLNQRKSLKRSNKRFKWSMIGIAGHPNCSYQSFLLLPESLSKSSKVTACHKSHFRDTCCRWASSLQKCHLLQAGDNHRWDKSWKSRTNNCQTHSSVS